MDKALFTYDRLNKGYNITVKGMKFIELENKMANLLRMPDAEVVPSIKWI